VGELGKQNWQNLQNKLGKAVKQEILGLQKAVN
jgi:hypothetical protein